MFKRKSLGGAAKPHQTAPALMAIPRRVRLSGRKSFLRFAIQLLTLSDIPTSASLSRTLTTSSARNATRNSADADKRITAAQISPR